MEIVSLSHLHLRCATEGNMAQHNNKPYTNLGHTTFGKRRPGAAEQEKSFHTVCEKLVEIKERKTGEKLTRRIMIIECKLVEKLQITNRDYPVLIVLNMD